MHGSGGGLNTVVGPHGVGDGVPERGKCAAGGRPRSVTESAFVRLAAVVGSIPLTIPTVSAMVCKAW